MIPFSAAAASFFPTLTPLYFRSDQTTVWGLDFTYRF